jgi:hypothetical protein
VSVHPPPTPRKKDSREGVSRRLVSVFSELEEDDLPKSFWRTLALILLGVTTACLAAYDLFGG